MSYSILPSVSIVIPAYNCENYIERCVSSCLSQDFGYPYEIVICDDASTDQTSAILTQLYDPKHHNLKLISHSTNSGVGSARNSCIKAATGRYLFLLDSDDYIHPQTLTLLYSSIELFHDVDIVYCDYVYVDDMDQRSSPINFDNKPIACAQLIKKSLFLKHGLYKDLRIGEEKEFMSRCLSTSLRRLHLPLPLYRYRQTNLSITAQFSSSRTYD